jgi:hypothetical protein
LFNYDFPERTTPQSRLPRHILVDVVGDHIRVRPSSALVLQLEIINYDEDEYRNQEPLLISVTLLFEFPIQFRLASPDGFDAELHLAREAA